MTIRLNPVPQTPLRDDPTQDAIWKRFLQFWIDKIQTAGTGSVTSVAQTVPTAEFSVAGSPITTSGTLAITKQVQNANKGWFGPTTGADAQPTFRALVTADLPSGTGTVTSVAANFTGGLISVGGSPITTSGTLALTVAGTSGGVPYFSGATTWASSGALANNAIVLGGGAGNPPATTTTGTGVVTALGVNVGTAGAFIVNGGALGTPSSGTVTNLTGTASININGTVGATTPTTGVFTTVTANTGVGTGAAPSTQVGVHIQNTALTGIDQYGALASVVANSAATVRIAGFAGNATNAAGAYTITDRIQFLALDPTKGAGSTITNATGFFIGDQTQGTNNYGIRMQVSAGANKYNLFIDGTAQNYIAGTIQCDSNVNIGPYTANTRFASSVSDNAVLATVAPVARFSNNGSGFITKIILSDNSVADAFINFSPNGTAASSLLGFGSGSTNQLLIDGNGQVRIPYVWANTGGTTAVLVDSAGALFKLASARKYKTDIQSYAKGLADVLKLEPVYYRLKSANGKGYLQAGLIADDLHENDFTEYVAYGPEGPDSINYGNMAALFVNAIKELNNEVATLKSRIAALGEIHVR